MWVSRACVLIARRSTEQYIDSTLELHGYTSKSIALYCSTTRRAVKIHNTSDHISWCVCGGWPWRFVPSRWYAQLFDMLSQSRQIMMHLFRQMMMHLAERSAGVTQDMYEAVRILAAVTLKLRWYRCNVVRHPCIHCSFLVAALFQHTPLSIQAFAVNRSMLPPNIRQLSRVFNTLPGSFSAAAKADSTVEARLGPNFP